LSREIPAVLGQDHQGLRCPATPSHAFNLTTTEVAI
jgi:hypothetical protein